MRAFPASHQMHADVRHAWYRKCLPALFPACRSLYLLSCINKQPPEGGCCDVSGSPLQMGCFNTQPSKAAGWRVLTCTHPTAATTVAGACHVLCLRLSDFQLIGLEAIKCSALAPLYVRHFGKQRLLGSVHAIFNHAKLPATVPIEV